MRKTSGQIIDQAIAAAEAAIEYLTWANNDLEKGLPTTATESVSAARARVITTLDTIALIDRAIEREFEPVKIPIETGAENET